MAEDLKTCPFCGGVAYVGSVPFNSMSGINPPETRSYFVACVSCATEGPWFKSEGNARWGWNHRVADEVDAARQDEREACLQALRDEPSYATRDECLAAVGRLEAKTDGT